MGRAALVLDELAAGRLVAPFGLPVRSHASYFFVTGMEPSPHAILVHEWLAVQAERFRRQRDALLEGLRRPAGASGPGTHAFPRVR